MNITRIIVMLSVATFFGCRGESAEQRGECDTAIHEPLLTIEKYIARDGDFEPNEIQIYSVLLDGSVLPVDQWGVEGGTEIRAASTPENWAFCDIPCALFSKEGNYSFEIVARGADDPSTIHIDASYEAVGSGCPKTYSGGVKMEVQWPGS